MALGFSGSNGGVGKQSNSFRKFEKKDFGILEKLYKIKCLERDILENRPSSLYLVDLFVNNKCNLKCIHCYDKYAENKNELSAHEIKNSISQLEELGARIFGIVGKEPLLSWDKTKEMLFYLKERKISNPKIRYGMVTNGTLLNESIAKELRDLDITYIDLSFDGAEEINNIIRGKDVYAKTKQAFKNLRNQGLEDRVTVSFTVNEINKHSFMPLIKDLAEEGLRKFLASPYLTSVKGDKLRISVGDYCQFAKEVSDELDKNNFGVEVYLKNDVHSRDYQIGLVENEILDLNNLVIDEHLALWDIKQKGRDRLLLNFQPWDTHGWYGIRISHDGYLSNCFSMLYEDYPKQEAVLGNIKNKPIKELLASYIK